MGGTEKKPTEEQNFPRSNGGYGLNKKTKRFRVLIRQTNTPHNEVLKCLLGKKLGTLKSFFGFIFNFREPLHIYC